MAIRRQRFVCSSFSQFCNLAACCTSLFQLICNLLLCRRRRARPPAVRTTAQPYTAGRPTFMVAAVRKSASEVPLRWFRSASSMPFASLRTSSAHSRGRLASSAEIPYCVLSSSGGERPTPPRPRLVASCAPYRAGARRSLRGAPRSACPAPWLRLMVSIFCLGRFEIH